MDEDVQVECVQQGAVMLRNVPKEIEQEREADPAAKMIAIELHGFGEVGGFVGGEMKAIAFLKGERASAEVLPAPEGD